jgi:A/G-specific adenine glycosylase
MSSPILLRRVRSPGGAAVRRLLWVVRRIARLPVREDRPWRGPEARRDPLRVLVAEMMLIRTKHRQAARVYEAFMRLPPEALRDAGRLRALLEGLGLRRRAEGILAALRHLEERGGRVPDDPEALRRIPYVGPYVASAVLCFAFGRPTPPVDSNVVRFTVRFFGLPAPHPSHPPPAHRDLWERACRLAPVRRDPAGFFARLLDFCIDVCAPRPRCGTCPLRARCPYPGRRRNRTASAKRRAATGGKASPIW